MLPTSPSALQACLTLSTGTNNYHFDLRQSETVMSGAFCRLSAGSGAGPRGSLDSVDSEATAAGMRSPGATQGAAMGETHVHPPQLAAIVEGRMLLDPHSSPFEPPHALPLAPPQAQAAAAALGLPPLPRQVLNGLSQTNTVPLEVHKLKLCLVAVLSDILSHVSKIGWEQEPDMAHMHRSKLVRLACGRRRRRCPRQRPPRACGSSAAWRGRPRPPAPASRAVLSGGRKLRQATWAAPCFSPWTACA